MPDNENKSIGRGFVGGEGLLGVGIAAVAFAQNKKPDGIGIDWLGPHWVAQLVGLVAFGFCWRVLFEWSDINHQ